MLRLTFGVVAVTLATTARAQFFEITSSTIDGGGGTMVGSFFSLSGTIGQPDASEAMTGNTFQITGGFWPTVNPPPPCPADLSPPYGLLDLADVLAFVGAFQANEAIADFDDNGLFDLADVLAFSNAFLSGCP